MKQLKKIAVLVVAVCLLISATGCLVQVNEEKNGKIVLATIDGKYDIIKSDFVSAFNQVWYQNYYYYYLLGYSLTDEQLTELKQDVLTVMIQDKIIHIEMDVDGFEINDEDLEKSRKDYEDMIQEYADDLKKKAEEAEDTSEDTSENTEETEEKSEDTEETTDYLQQAKDYYLNLFKENDTTEEEYIRECADTYRVERYKKSLVGEITVSDDEIKAYYDEQVAAQTEKPDLDSDVLIFVPANVVYKYIKVTLTTEEKTAYDALVNEKKTEEAAAYLEETSKKRATEYLARINGGEEFETVLEEANKYLVDNCGVAESAVIAKDETSTLYKDVGKSGFSGDFDTIILGKKAGEVTDVIDATNGTYLIGKVIERKESETKTYEVGDEDVYKSIKEHLNDTKYEEQLKEKLNDLYNAHSVKKYEKRLLADY